MKGFRTSWLSVFAVTPLLVVAAALPDKKQPKIGVQTPGIQIAMTELKPEADISLPGPADSLVAGDAVYASSSTKGALIRIDPKGNKPESLEGVAKPCGGILSAFGSLWVPDCAEGIITRIDPRSKKTTGKVLVSVAGSGSVLAATAESVWVLADEKTTLIRIDPEENKPVAEIRLPESCNALFPAEASLWVTCPKIDKVLRINPVTNLVDKRLEVPGRPTALTAGEGSIWVLTSKEGKVARLDPKTEKVTATVDLNIPDAKGTISFGEGYVWVSAPGFPLSRIDPATDKVAQQFRGGNGAIVVATSGAVWLADPSAGTLHKFDVKRIKATLAP